MAIKLQQYLVEILEWWMARERRFASDFSLFFARIGVLIWNVNLSLDMCTFKFALVYTLISRFCFCSFALTIWVLNASWMIWRSHTLLKGKWGCSSSTISSNVSYQPQKGSWAIWWGKGIEFHPFPKLCWQNFVGFLGKTSSVVDSLGVFMSHDLWWRSIFRFFLEIGSTNGDLGKLVI
jgi:hypothetical protein